MTTRTDIKNTHMFNTQGHGTGVWVGAGVTRTKPSRTLFVTAIPFSVELEAVQALFKGEPGYTGFRAHPHRRMVFVDFVNERQSTSAMRKYQGHKLVESKPGIAIDFDKDPVSKRNHAYEHDLQTKRFNDDDSAVLRYYCSKCHTRCVVLDKLKALHLMPQRSTDSSYCVDETKYLKAVNVVKGEMKLVKREKGIERQFPLNCTLCDITVAYRPVPVGEATKFLYVVAGALTSDGRQGSRSDPSNVVGVAHGTSTGGEAGAGAGAGAGASAPRASIASLGRFLPDPAEGASTGGGGGEGAAAGPAEAVVEEEEADGRDTKRARVGDADPDAPEVDYGA